MMIPHGTPRTAAPSSAARATSSIAAAANAESPRLVFKATTPRIQIVMIPRVSCWCRVSAVTGASVVAG